MRHPPAPAAGPSSRRPPAGLTATPGGRSRQAGRLQRPRRARGDELAVKQVWWRQLLDPQLHQQLPRPAMVDRFEWHEHEPEVGGPVDWRVTGSPALRGTFRAELPAWALTAAEVPPCGA
ncbi:hypothetical protein [Blastococcus saxobsidens]|nr:hypothetical protein [Blastococcus saxobsidens]